MKSSASCIATTFLVLLFGSGAGSAFAGQKQRLYGRAKVIEHIRKELATLPYYGVFDNLAFKLTDDDTLFLYGEVVRPVTRDDAEHRVSRIEGIERVVNKIKVLPLSPFDESLRRRLYRAIF
ncbi:MAG TPA: BON domain-containing protein, partial [Blastocatellia bacterium]|nr:BON domain-containing protein [Blastocatellia bacterium]